MMPKPSNTLLGLTFQELGDIVAHSAEPAYRARQLFQALYAERVEKIDEMATLPLSFRQTLAAQGIGVGMPKIENKFTSTDGTVRYLMSFPDGQSVETVWMPEGDGGEAGDGSEAAEEMEGEDQARAWRRATICVSSQVGCAVDCQFCLTALLGLKRNLSAGEIVGQVCAVLNDISRGGKKVAPPDDRINLVFMGMGEPLLNYDNVMQSIRYITSPDGLNMAQKRITVSCAPIE